LGALVVCLFVPLACEGEDIGKPCETDDDCGSKTFCDIHQDMGSCQRPHSHGSTPDAGGDVAELCPMLCACLESTCTDVDGYPFSAPSTCEPTCMSWDAETVNCGILACDAAAATDPPDGHECTHAWEPVPAHGC